MTLTELAAEYKISKSTMYRRLSQLGISTSKVAVAGQLTATGEVFLRSKLSPSPVPSSIPIPSPIIETGNETEIVSQEAVPDNRDAQIAELRQQIADLQATLSVRDARIVDLERTLVTDAETISRLTADDSPQAQLARQAMCVLSDAQKVQAMLISANRQQLLEPKQVRVGLWGRVFRHRKT